MNSRICSNPDCSHNGESQDLSEFYKDRGHITGVSYNCKTCNNFQRQKNRIKNRISNLVADCIRLHKSGPRKNKAAIAENSLMIFKLGLIK